MRAVEAMVEVVDVANQTVGNRKPDCPDETCVRGVDAPTMPLLP